MTGANTGDDTDNVETKTINMVSHQVTPRTTQNEKSIEKPVKVREEIVIDDDKDAITHEVNDENKATLESAQNAIFSKYPPEKQLGNNKRPLESSASSSPATATAKVLKKIAPFNKETAQQKVFSSSSKSSTSTPSRKMDFYILDGAFFDQMNVNKSVGKKNAYLNEVNLPVIPGTNDKVRIDECKNDRKVIIFIKKLQYFLRGKKKLLIWKKYVKR